MLARLSLLLLALVSLTAGCPSPSDPPEETDASVPPPGPDAGADAAPPAATCSQPDGFLLDSAAAVAAIASCEVITGDLVITASSPAVVDLPALKEIVGSLRATEAPQLGSFSARALRRVSGDVKFTGDEDLEKLELGFLHTVGGVVLLANIPVNEIRFDSLSRVEQLLIGSVPATAILFPVLEQVGTIDSGQNRIGIRIDGAFAAIPVAFPELRIVHGSIELRQIGGPGAATEIDFSLLETSGPLWIEDVRAHELTIPELRTVIGEVRITGSAIDVLQPVRLASIGGGLFMHDNFHLPDLVFPALTSLGKLAIGDCQPSANDGQAHLVHLPQVEHLESLFLCGDPGVRELSLDRLELVVFLTQVEDMEQLRTLKSPALAQHIGKIIVQDNPVLESWDEALTSIGSQTSGTPVVLVVRGNPKLSCRAGELVAAVAPGKTADIGDNGAGCAP